MGFSIGFLKGFNERSVLYTHDITFRYKANRMIINTMYSKNPDIALIIFMILQRLILNEYYRHKIL